MYLEKGGVMTMFFNNKKTYEHEFIIDIINAHTHTIRKILSYRLHSPSEHDLQDCTQEVYLIIAQEIKKIIHHPHIRGWICVCCRNVATNYNSKIIDKRSQLFEIRDYLSDSINLEDTVINKITYDNAVKNNAFENIIGSLSKSETILYRLRWSEKLSEKQIAQKLNISSSAVKNRIMRLRRKIQSKVKEYT